MPALDTPLKPAMAQDRTGRQRLGRNVAFAWGGYMIHLVTGFVLPRLISDRLGQTTLGIWDFSWSFVSYFGLVQLGLGSSVNRYVAKYRALNDVPGLTRSVSTIALFHRCVAGLAAVLGAVTALWLMPLFAERLGDGLSDARWIVFILGLEVAISISLTAYGAVIVGCHRWDLHNTISAICYALTAVGMIVALALGGGLVSCAAVHCVVMSSGEITRFWLSRRVCPELVVDYRTASWSVLKEQAGYSAKTLVPRIAHLVSNQALSILLVAFLGPASLAVFSRPRSLIRSLQTLSAKFGHILVPTASSLHALNEKSTLRKTMLDAPAFIASLAIPSLATLAILGDDIMRMWMGDQYIYPGLMAVLAIGSLGTVVQEPVWSLLSGMNKHGRIALMKLGAAFVSAALLALGLAVFEWDLLGAAVCFILPQVVIDAIITPIFACRRTGVPVSTFWWKTALQPALCALPYMAGLAVTVLVVRPGPLQWLATVCGATASLLCYILWQMPAALRSRAHNILTRTRRFV